jgi:hypothetical protein
VASSARPEAAFWREKFLAAICSTREVERKETTIVARSAVMRRVRMRAEPEEERAAEGLTTIERRGRREKEQPKVGPKGEGAGATESKDTEVDCRKGERRKTEHMPAGAGWLACRRLPEGRTETLGRSR